MAFEVDFLAVGEGPPSPPRWPAFALKTNAAALPGFLVWEQTEREGKGGGGRAKGSYVLHFGPELPLSRTPDSEQDILAATALCTAILESWIRRYPDQWLWVHRRWKTRPEGEAKLYA